MNISLTKIAGIAILCAASAFGGYFAGNSASDIQHTADAASAQKSTRASTASGSSSSSAPARVPGLTLDQLLHVKGRVNADTLAEWAKGLSPDEVAGALESLRNEPASARRNEIMGALYNSMAERDPKGFLTTDAGSGIPRLREGGINTALKAWAAEDPKAALQWLKDNPGSGSAAANQQRLAAAIAGFATKDPEGALATVNALGDATPRDRNLKSAAIKALADAVTEQGNFSQAAKLFNDLPAGEVRQDAYAQLAQRWAESNPKEAAEWVASIPASEAQMRGAMGIEVTRAWADIDPSGAAAWAAQMDQAALANAAEGEGLQGRLLATAIQSWAEYDLDAPGAFLNTLPSSPAKDGSVAIFALRASGEDPQAAINWVGTITNENMRNGATFVVALQWMQQDQAGFQQFVQTTDKLNEQQKTLLGNLPPQAAQGIQQMTRLMGGEAATQRLMENIIINGGAGAFGGRGLGGRGAGGGFNGGGRGFGGGQ